MIKRRYSSFLLILLISLSLTLNGCAAGGKGSASASSPDVANTEPQAGGILRVVFGASQSESDLYPPTTANQILLWNARPCLEPLFEMDSAGNVLPYLIEDYLVSNDLKEYTLHVRKGITFSDGSPFDAEAIKWNFEQTQKEGINDFCNRMQEIDVVDPYTLRIRLDKADVLFIKMLATNKAALMVSPTAVKANGIEWAKTNPVGTGPFILQSWDYGVEMVFVKNENYWQEGLPYLDGITYHFINNNAVLRASYDNDEYDMVLNPSSSLLSALMKEGERCVVYDYPYNAFNLWFPSAVEGSPFSSELVRKAVCHAIDMPSIIDALFGDEFISVNQLSHPKNDNWNSDIQGYSYDVKKAKELLSEAGYPNGFNTSIIAQSSEQNKLLCEAIQSYLKEVGIMVSIDMADEARYVENVILNTWGDQMALIVYTFTPDEISSMVRMLNPETCLFLHTVNFSDAYHKAFDNILSSVTIEQAASCFREADKILIDDEALVLPVYICQYAVAQKGHVHGAGTGLDSEIQTRYWRPESIWIEK